MRKAIALRAGASWAGVPVVTEIARRILLSFRRSHVSFSIAQLFLTRKALADSMSVTGPATPSRSACRSARDGMVFGVLAPLVDAVGVPRHACEVGSGGIRMNKRVQEGLESE